MAKSPPAPPFMVPSWAWGELHGQPAAPELSERALAQFDPTDRRIAVLTLGCGYPLGTVVSVLRLDPAVADWRLTEGLRRAAEELAVEPSALERGISAALRGRGGPRGENLLSELTPEQLERLAARLASEGNDGLHGVERAGLGIGSLGLIVLAAFVFLAYGIVRDENPSWRGKALARQGQYAEARDSFSELGPSPEGRAWTAICWLAEGDYERALTILREPDVSQYLGVFRLMETPLAPVEKDPESPALLPRGLVDTGRPRFVVRYSAEDMVTLESVGDEMEQRNLRVRLPGEVDPGSFLPVPFPASTPPLGPGTYLWSVLGSPDHPSSFTVVSRELHRDIQRTVLEKLTHEIPDPARAFLRVQLDLRHGLLVDAGEGLSRLVEQFPDQRFPREQLARVAHALGVDPDAFLR